jgi:hypothetical protein
MVCGLLFFVYCLVFGVVCFVSLKVQKVVGTQSGNE